MGFQEVRQKGSNLILKHPDGRAILVAMHAKTLSKGTFKAILKQAGISEETFTKAL